MSQLVTLNFEGQLARLEINRPESLNALNQEVLRELGTAAGQISTRPDVHVVILSGAGDKAFVAGADIKQMMSLSGPEAHAFSRLGNSAFLGIEMMPQIVIAQVQGFALGGGLELALAADFIIASHNARFGLPEVGLGLIPGFGGTQRLARKVGLGRAMELICTAARINANEAVTMGLANRAVAPEELASTVENIVASILRNGPGAVRAAKQAVRGGLDLPLSGGLELEAALFGLRFGSSEAKEGLAAFVEKRTPQFSRTVDPQ